MAFTNNRVEFRNGQTLLETEMGQSFSYGINDQVTQGLYVLESESKLTAGTFFNGGFGRLGNIGETIDVPTNYSGYITIKTEFMGQASKNSIEFNNYKLNNDRLEETAPNTKYYTIYYLENGEVIDDYTNRPTLNESPDALPLHVNLAELGVLPTDFESFTNLDQALHFIKDFKNEKYGLAKHVILSDYLDPSLPEFNDLRLLFIPGHQSVNGYFRFTYEMYSYDAIPAKLEIQNNNRQDLEFWITDNFDSDLTKHGSFVRPKQEYTHVFFSGAWLANIGSTINYNVNSVYTLADFRDLIVYYSYYDGSFVNTDFDCQIFRNIHFSRLQPGTSFTWYEMAHFVSQGSGQGHTKAFDPTASGTFIGKTEETLNWNKVCIRAIVGYGIRNNYYEHTGEYNETTFKKINLSEAKESEIDSIRQRANSGDEGAIRQMEIFTGEKTFENNDELFEYLNPNLLDEQNVLSRKYDQKLSKLNDDDYSKYLQNVISNNPDIVNLIQSAILTEKEKGEK